jgi:hypothetical protein
MYYAAALSVPLQGFRIRELLALLCRTAPTIPIYWFQSWPERATLEDLYQRTLALLVRAEDGNPHFIHNSRIAFLKNETRSKLPEVDHAALVRPLLLAGLEAAWTLGEYGHVVRFML